MTQCYEQCFLWVILLFQRSIPSHCLYFYMCTFALCKCSRLRKTMVRKQISQELVNDVMVVKFQCVRHCSFSFAPIFVNRKIAILHNVLPKWCAKTQRLIKQGMQIVKNSVYVIFSYSIGKNEIMTYPKSFPK